jgi:hypothetical protein
MNILFKNNVNYKLKNSDNKKPMELASDLMDFETICLLFEYILKKKQEKNAKTVNLLCSFLNQSQDFYMEMKWEVKVPMFSFLCPSDICKIWKVGDSMRLDYSFQKFKKLKTHRKPSSYIFNGNNFYQVDWKNKVYYDPLEPLHEDEKLLIIKDIMANYKIGGDIKFKKCSIKPTNKKKVYETVNGHKSVKYDLSITSEFAIQSKTKIDYFGLNRRDYFNPMMRLDRQVTVIAGKDEIKKNIEETLKIKNSNIRKELFESSKEKSYKANVWIAENFPLKSSQLYDIFKTIQDANELTMKIKDFLNRDEVRNIISVNGFPVKIKIPINFFVDICISFAHYKEIKPEDHFDKTIFAIPGDIKRISRKCAMNLKDNPKKRLAFVNY